MRLIHGEELKRLVDDHIGPDGKERHGFVAGAYGGWDYCARRDSFIVVRIDEAALIRNTDEDINFGKEKTPAECLPESDFNIHMTNYRNTGKSFTPTEGFTEVSLMGGYTIKPGHTIYTTILEVIDIPKEVMCSMHPVTEMLGSGLLIDHTDYIEGEFVGNPYVMITNVSNVNVIVPAHNPMIKLRFFWKE